LLIGECDEREDGHGDGGHNNDGHLGRAPTTVVESSGQASPQGGRVRDNGVGRQRQLGWPTGVPLSGWPGVEGSAANLGPRGAMEDWGVPIDDVGGGSAVEL
jgi:hypothetical protein